jgi:hypothetical protein
VTAWEVLTGHPDLDVANGTRGYVTALEPAGGSLTIRTGEGERARDVTLPPAEAEHPTVREQLAALDQQLAGLGKLGHRWRVP